MKSSLSNKHGFTLIELLITIAISGVVTVALYQTFNSQQKSYLIQEEVATMQQSARAAIMLLSDDFRMAGYDKLLTGNFGITAIFPRNTNTTLLGDSTRGAVDTSFSANSSIVITADFNEDGTIDNNEQVQYQVYDFDAGDGQLDLARQVGGASNRLLAENIVKLGLAFAFDENMDGRLDTYMATGGGNEETIIWAIDSDGDNFLDRNLDTNLDGQITFLDGPGGVDVNILGTNLVDFSGNAIPNVPTTAIKAIRVWLLIETAHQDPTFTSNTAFVVGKYIVTQSPNNRCRLIEATVNCRNM